MASVVWTYDPEKVYFLVDGIPITGYADGTFLTIEEMTDGVTSQSGADGEVVRAMSTDRRVTITCTLQQTSLSNIVLSNFYIADKISGAGMVPFLVEDLTGGISFAAGQGWIDKMANRVYAKGIETREWKMTAVASTLSSMGYGPV
jgi:hypothetical protein